MAQNEVTLKIKIKDDGSFKLVTDSATKSSIAIDEVTQSTNRLNTTTAKASKSRNAFSKQEKGVSGSTSNTTKAFAKQAQTMGGGSGLIAAYATLAANIFAITAAFGVLKRAAAFEQLEQGLLQVGNAAGANLPLVARKLRDITGAAISTKEAMTSVALGTSAGFSTAQMEGLTKVAKGASLALGRDMADAMSRLTRGAAKLEPEILDELGIMVRLDDATKSYAQTIGKTVGDLTQFERRMAFTNAIIEQGTQKFGEIANAINANPYDKLSATFEDLTQTVLEAVNVAFKPLVALLASSPTALAGILTLFSTIIISKIIPSIQTMAATSAAAAATSAKAWSASLAKTNAEVVKMKGSFSNFKGLSKSAKASQEAMRQSSAGIKDTSKHLKNLENSEARILTKHKFAKKFEQGHRDAKAGWQIKNMAASKARLAVLQLEIAKTKELALAQQQASGGKVGKSASRAKNKEITSGITSKGLSDMDGAGLLGSFKISGKATKQAFKAISSVTGALGKFGAAARAGGVAVKLFGSSLLKLIPYLGWALMAYELIIMAMDAFGITLSRTSEAAEKAIESFDSFTDISTQLAGSLAVAETETDRYTLTLDASLGVIGQAETGLLAIAEVNFKALSVQLAQATTDMRRLEVSVKDADEEIAEAIESGNFLARAWAELSSAGDRRKIINLGTDIREVSTEIEETAVITEETTKVLEAFEDSLDINPNLKNTFTAQYIKNVEELNDKFKGKKGSAAARKYRIELGRLDEQMKAGQASIKGAAAAYAAVKQAQDAFFKKSDGPLQGMIDKWSALQSSYLSVKDTSGQLAWAVKAGMDPSTIQPMINKLTTIQDVMEASASEVIRYKSEMQGLKSTMKTSQEDTLAYYVAEKTLHKKILEDLNAQMDLAIIGNATAKQKLVITNKIRAVEKRATSADTINQKYALAGLGAAKLKYQANLKSLELKNKEMLLESKLLSMSREDATIQANIAKEQAILASNLRGEGGTITAKEELALFKEQANIRTKQLEQETQMKIAMIDMEYALLEARLLASENEMATAAYKIDDPVDRATAIDKIPDMSGYLTNLREAKTLAIDIATTQSELKGIQELNKGLALANKESAEFYGSIKKSFSLMEDDAYELIANSAIDALKTFSDVNDARIGMEEALTQTSVELQEAKLAKFRKLDKDFNADTSQEDNKILRLEKKVAAKKTAIKKGEEDSKLNLAIAGAGATAGILEGLAATQDTTSRSGFEAAKKLNMGAAIVATAAAAMSEYKIGGPVAAAAAIAAGAVQIATIASTSFEGGGGGAPTAAFGSVGSGTGGSSIQASAIGVDRPPETETTAQRLSTESLYALAEASDSASLAMSRIGSGVTGIDDILSEDSRQFKVLNQQLGEALQQVGSKSGKNLATGVGPQGVQTYKIRGSGPEGDPIVKAMQEQLDVFNTELHTAFASLGFTDVDLSNIETFGAAMDLDHSVEENTAEITRAFESYGNAAAESIIGGFTEFGDIGLEKLFSLSNSLIQLNEEFGKLGFKDTFEGIDNAAIAEQLIEGLGGADSFSDIMEQYGDIVLSDTERLAASVEHSTELLGYTGDAINQAIIDSAAENEGLIDTAAFEAVRDMFSLETFSKEDFSTVSEDLRLLAQDGGEQGALAQAVWTSLLQSLDDFEVYWEGADEAATKLREYADLEADLLEEQGFSYKALSMQRVAAIAELEELGDAEGARITALINAQEDLNATRSLELGLLEALRLGEAALALERDAVLRSLEGKPVDQMLQQAIWNLEDLAKEEANLTKVRDDSIKNLEAAYKYHIDGLKEAFASLLEGLTEDLDAAKANAESLRPAIDSLVAAREGQQVDSRANRAKARGSVRELTAEVGSGDYSNLDQLDGLISILTNQNSDLYSTSLEQQRDAELSKIALFDLEKVAGDQLTDAEKTIELLEAQIELATKQHDIEVRRLEDALSATLGLDDSVLTISQATNEYYRAQASLDKVAAEAAIELQKSQDLQVLSLNEILNLTDQLPSAIEAFQGGYFDTLILAIRALDLTADREEPVMGSGTVEEVTSVTPTEPISSGNFTNSQVSAAVDSIYASGGTNLDIYNAAVANGVTSSQLAESMGIPETSVTDWVDREGVAKFASGGTFAGGLRMVGERGPELEYTGPSRIYSNSDTQKMFDTSAVEDELKELRAELRAAQYMIAKSTSDTSRMLERWDGDGMPETRVV